MAEGKRKRRILAGMTAGVCLLCCGCGSHAVDQAVPKHGEVMEKTREMSEVPRNAMVNFALRGSMADALRDFYEITVTQRGRLREDMPEFTFELTAYWDMDDRYGLQSIEVRDGDRILQTISIPELACFRATWIYDWMDTLGFALEDVNFDGYLDIRQFDTSNGNYRQEWIYLVWNPEKYMFEHDARLNEISLAAFDQEKKLIYGMERGGAIYHYYSTYQYIDGELVKIKYEEREGLLLDDWQVEEFCAAASGKEEETGYEGSWYYEHVMERDSVTGELETVSEEYVFYCDNENGELSGWDWFHVDAASSLGSRITQAVEQE